jgi:putative DNA primase/helicase
VLNFTRKFQGADADVNIAQSIIESDLSGIASWALEGAARLESRGGYQIPPSSDVALYQWRHRSDVVLRWVEETGLKPQDDAQISQSLLYQAFDAWISANGHQRVTSATFSERLQNAGFRQIAKRGIPHFFAKYSPISE